jgi:hypothetical protein
MTVLIPEQKTGPLLYGQRHNGKSKASSESRSIAAAVGTW